MVHFIFKNANYIKNVLESYENGLVIMKEAIKEFLTIGSCNLITVTKLISHTKRNNSETMFYILFL